MPRRRPELWMPKGAFWQGDAVSRLSVEQGHVVRKQYQPTRNAILQQNQDLQREPEALRDLDWSQWALSIPELDYKRLIKKYPELNSPDSGLSHRAWQRFLASSESDPYRVRARDKARR